MFWRRVRLRSARGFEISFADKGKVLRQVEEFAEMSADNLLMSMEYLAVTTTPNLLQIEWVEKTRFWSI
ncbi:MAG: hypothetical protein B7O98_00990 [Zestosphaera tikiterensis]|uniref:Uncharacterized protein n=1 Tax=Zestosphaera tikiterensis TaxID=1973259 RepID=A0A2R7Y8Z7_9CREN|nr:MAG: hypothetical protein B7O98_00990 [Zestosphaera tikiterensis]